MLLLDRFYAVALGMCAFYLLLGVPFVFVRKGAAAALLVVLMLTVLASWRLSRVGKPRESVLLYALVSWCIVVTVLFAGLPLYTAMYMSAVAVVMAIVVGLRAGIALALSYIAAWCVYVVLQRQGMSVAAYFNPPPAVSVFGAAGAMWLILLPLPLLLRKLHAASGLLRAVIEATGEGILVVNQLGEIETYNQRFLEMWGVSQELADTGDDAQLLDKAMQQLVDPDQFRRGVAELYGQPERSSKDILVFKDGRIFERLSNPERVDSVVVGRVWSFRDITERERARMEFQQAKEQVQAVLNATTEGIFLVDRRGMILVINDTAAQRLGRTADQLLNRCVFDFFPRDVAATRSASLEQVFITGRGKYVEDVRDGRSFAMNYYPVLSDQGVVRQVVVYAVEISERRRAEAQLVGRQARLSSLVAAIQDTMVVYDDDGRLLEILGSASGSYASFAPVEVNPLGKLCSELMQPEVANQFLRAIRILRSGGPAVSFEYQMGPTQAPLDFVASLSRIGDGSGYLAVLRDVSAKRSARREIERLGVRNKLLLESVGEGIFDLDAHCRTTFVNPAALTMLGRQELEVLGIDPHAVFHFHPGADHEGVVYECPVQASLADGQQRQDDNQWFWRADGRRFPVSLTVTPIVEEGRQVGVVVVFRDITERKRIEAEVHLLAFHDALTKLPNRRLLIDRLGQQLAHCKRGAELAALLFMDLDNFKQLNDLHGHAAGDLLMVEVARRVSDCVREIDTVARFGGDEFVVLLANLDSVPEIARQNALLVAEKIRHALAQDYHIVLPQDDGQDEHVHHLCSASIGVCIFPMSMTSPDEVIDVADAAMYRAKESGRNAVFVAP